ncbi:hypothetical protein DFH06DRAFT_992196 [Mycena polygramma]|nr:hypothetical protein DFH06DRAFT_992196 [Mycena polygramma]
MSGSLPRQPVVASASLALLPSASPHEEAPPAPPPQFHAIADAVRCPAEAAPWFRAVFPQISRETLATPYQALLRAYVEFEESKNWVQMGGLPKVPRPSQVGEWIRDGRGLRDGRGKDRPQDIVDLGSFESEWWTWWTALQPSWRGAWRGRRKAGVAQTLPEGADWGKLSSSGQNGVLSVVATLYWWACAEKEKAVGPSAGWIEAVGDVTWVMRAMKL